MAAVALGSVFLILVAAGVYFVPTLGRLADHTALTATQMTVRSRTWIRLKVAWIIALLGLLADATIALVRAATPAAVSREHRKA